MRVVLDTNCVISALLFDGRLAWLRRAWQNGRVVPVVSAATTRELLRVLAYPKFRLTEAERDELLAEFLPYAEAVTISGPPRRLPAVADPGDRPFVELAIAGGAEALVTGDRGLLGAGPSLTVPVLAPAELRRRLGE